MSDALHVAVSLPIPNFQDTPPTTKLLEVARILDRGGIHALLLRDEYGHGLPDGNGGQLDPLALTGVLLAGTQQLGVVPEVAVVDQVPFHLARRLASLDHVSKGRVGVHLRAPRPFGSRAKLHLLELVTVLRGLWDSYDDGAPVRDQASGVYYRPEERQALDHHGMFYQVAGPLNLSRPPQGYPPIFLSLLEAAHLPVAARVADVTLLPVPEARGAGDLPRESCPPLKQPDSVARSAARWVTWPPVIIPPHPDMDTSDVLANHLEHLWLTHAAHGVQVGLTDWSPAAVTVMVQTMTRLRERRVVTPAHVGQHLRERFSLSRPARKAVA
ncbi:LLM class flavin-dependent oxidoreductase [Deinococcus hopiensis]|uniref:Coenzyme F420-dependent N5,N10-methylene tetrahydromethanopterin reductase and related flavin-dependent oxidoreductases n=1 Tax=Deinococcus hopiensis KR-140 TaxID=695939 RepID=A0A1W1UVR4_9DEIO|nr:LLM class flavin-dependent oxidoreductase [Deinococcus hopiensis]SMB85245.1 Coenzyme F420-dependent N5,N10-methylene tetrahydromethanopterin reductase and related flavin-dependent oxidoreductases [Deinococcus hopiensis KR-140]